MESRSDSASQNDSSIASSRQQTPLSIHTGTRTPSNQSLLTPSHHRSFASNSDVSAIQEAEVISRATTQAISAARSILLSGGTQSSALFTATAAAQSVLIPRSFGGEKPPLGPSNKGFFGRRKNMRQAEVIASVALVSVNSALSSPRADGRIESPLHRDMIIHGPYTHASGTVSEFTEDTSRYPSSPKSEATGMRSLSNGSPLRLDPRSSVDVSTGNFVQPIPEVPIMTPPSQRPQDYPSPTFSASKYVQPSRSSTSNNGKNEATVNNESVVSKGKSTTDDTRSPIAAKQTDANLNFLSYFLKKQARVDDRQSPKSSIPEEMPMPRSKVDRTKTDLSEGKDEPTYETRTLLSSLNPKSDASTSTGSSESKTNLTRYESSAEESHTTSDRSDEYEDERTVESATMTRGEAAPKTAEEEGSYFGVDPLITSFNDVFSCGPDSKSPWNASQARDANDSTRKNIDDANDDTESRDRPNETVNITALKITDSDLLLQDLRTAEEASGRNMKKRLSRLSSTKRGNVAATAAADGKVNSSIEHVVMRALTSLPNSPPSRPASTVVRPSLNLERPPYAAKCHSSAKQHTKSKRTVVRDNSMTAYTIISQETKVPSSDSKSKPPPNLVAPLSSSSMSGFDQPGGSGEDSSASVGEQEPARKAKLPWFRRNKKTLDVE